MIRTCHCGCRMTAQQRRGVWYHRYWFVSRGHVEAYQRSVGVSPPLRRTEDAAIEDKAVELVANAEPIKFLARASAMPKPEPYVPAKRPERIVFGNVPLLVAARMIVESGPGFVSSKHKEIEDG